MTLLRPSSIHPHYRTKQKRVTKPSKDDKATGKVHEVKGTIKEKIGQLADNEELEADGKAEKDADKVQNRIGKLENLVGE